MFAFVLVMCLYSECTCVLIYVSAYGGQRLALQGRGGGREGRGDTPQSLFTLYFETGSAAEYEGH